MSTDLNPRQDMPASRPTAIRRDDGREWRIENSAEGIPLVFGDGKYDHDPPRVASRLESALADQLQGCVSAGWALNDAVIDILRAPTFGDSGTPSRLWDAVEAFQAASPERGQ